MFSFDQNVQILLQRGTVKIIYISTKGGGGGGISPENAAVPFCFGNRLGGANNVIVIRIYNI